MVADEGSAGRRMRKRELHAAAKQAVQGVLNIGRQRASDDKPAEGNRRAGLGLPEFSQVDDLLQAFRRIGEAILVDDESGIIQAVQERGLDRREEERGLLAGAGK